MAPNGWKSNGKHSWVKDGHTIRVRPTDSSNPRGSKTVWLIENSRIGGRSTRIGYCKTYAEGEKLAATFMRKW